MTNHNGHFTNCTDFDLHGFVGIRLLDASPSDVRVIYNQLGPIQKQLDRDPDITIRFVDELPVRSRVSFIGLNDAAFTEDAFLILRSEHKSRAKVQIPFDKIGQTCEIICERGLPAVPLLIAIVNNTALSNGILPMHASAFTYDGVGILATGWAKGGKTEALLGFMEQGAKYVGDEWVYLSEDGKQMFGIPEPIRIWNWHLQDLPVYQAKVERATQARLKSLNLLVETMDRMISVDYAMRSVPGKLVQRLTPILRRQLNVRIPPISLFGEKYCSLQGSPDKIIFLASHESKEIRVQPVDVDEIARRMVYSLQEERLDFQSYYLKYRFAFPERSNPLIEGAQEIQEKMLLKVLKDKEAYAVYHPYPVPIPALFEAIRPLIQ